LEAGIRTPPASGRRKKLVAKRIGGSGSKKKIVIPDKYKQLRIGQFFKNKIPAEEQKFTGGKIVASGIAEPSAGNLDGSALATDGAGGNLNGKRKLGHCEVGTAKKVKVGGNIQGVALNPGRMGVDSNIGA
jgi:hypothetical protein